MGRATPVPSRKGRSRPGRPAPVYGGLQLLYLPLAQRGSDALEVPQPLHAHFMAHTRLQIQSGDARGVRRHRGRRPPVWEYCAPWPTSPPTGHRESSPAGSCATPWGGALAGCPGSSWTLRAAPCGWRSPWVPSERGRSCCRLTACAWTGGTAPSSCGARPADPRTVCPRRIRAPRNVGPGPRELPRTPLPRRDSLILVCGL